MAKLIILSQDMAGRSHELAVDKTTIGRMDDNTFAIAESSVSSHHCEVYLRGQDVVVNDLNSTNGTFINGTRVTEATVLKPGQILRLGQVELRLEVEGAAAPAAAPAKPAAAKPTSEIPTSVQRGVSLTDLEQGGRRPEGATSKAFTKKENKGNKIFLIAAISVGVIIVLLVLFALLSASKPAQ
ncbi:MAG TPA: FHA domain-containing protein [Verrucomicrobiota bacterium]|nr:FHA domain-containing protein [Verrucomicrobiota bacterium]HNT14854.1 FHA domain-containing protein [Verrucomicrobiota bacterium]